MEEFFLSTFLPTRAQSTRFWLVNCSLCSEVVSFFTPRSAILILMEEWRVEVQILGLVEMKAFFWHPQCSSTSVVAVMCLHEAKWISFLIATVLWDKRRSSH